MVTQFFDIFSLCIITYLVLMGSDIFGVSVFRWANIVKKGLIAKRMYGGLILKKCFSSLKGLFILRRVCVGKNGLKNKVSNLVG